MGDVVPIGRARGPKLYRVRELQPPFDCPWLHGVGWLRWAVDAPDGRVVALCATEDEARDYAARCQAAAP
jgi:hypothetical protein